MRGTGHMLKGLAFMTYVILQVFDRTMAARVPMMNTWWFFLHWIYGGLLGLFAPPLRAACRGPSPYRGL